MPRWLRGPKQASAKRYNHWFKSSSRLQTFKQIIINNYMEDAYSVDNNVIKWSGFYNSEEEAQKDLEQKLQKFALKKKIVSAKKELQIKRRDNDLIYKLKEVQKTREIKKMLLYKFTIVTASKD
jgi:hypothetical protein